ncbi:MAG: DUF3459 domain-containing protein [Actinobacteria bacterium]|nr:MAG: DUF3459 domain-containing protein [Actinomycetota bacterium]
MYDAGSAVRWTATSATGPGTSVTTESLRGRLAQGLGDDPQASDVLARWDRWGPDLVTAVGQLYPTAARRVVDLIADAHRSRSQVLRDRDRARLLRPDWFQDPGMIGYAAYTERFGGTLQGVADRIGYLQDLGVTYLHLMPMLRTRPGPNDGGYAVADYNSIRPDLGSMQDLEELATRLHDAGISLTLDLVLNHVAREHAWARAARAGLPRQGDYFWTFEDRAVPDAFERDLVDVFPDTSPGNFTWDSDLRAWVWTTFNEYQWDLNWSNPDVLCEFVRIVLALANRGVDCLRLDAIAFLGKRLGTSCQNQPEVHTITGILRAAARIAAPALIFKAEAIVPPSEVVAYFGRGHHAGRLSDLAYHNSLMVQIWSALATRDARLLAIALNRMGSNPPTTAWATYLRCHDDIGWAIEDHDAAAVGWDGCAHRRFLSDFYSGGHDASFADGMAFEANPRNGDMRINGTAASLCGIGDPTQKWAVERMLLAYAMVLGFGGVPVIFMGDEIALLNDDSYALDPEHREDSRWVHRPAMPWDEPLDDRATAVGTGLRHLIDVRRRAPGLHAAVSSTVHVTCVDSVVCVVRRHPAEEMVQVYNVADHPVRVPAWEIDHHVPGATHDLLSAQDLEPVGDQYHLAPYEVLWLTRPDS